MDVESEIQKIKTELARAISKHPYFPVDPIHAAAVIGEEAGELVQAALQVTYENGNWSRLREEAVQVGAMALRFLINIEHMECKPSIPGQRSDLKDPENRMGM